MPLATAARLTFTEVDSPARLAYQHLADFIPGVKPYSVATEVAIEDRGNGVRVALTIEAMHDAAWTNRMVMGWESELGKLGEVLAARR